MSVTARARSGGAVFVGIGPRDQVTAWLGTTAYDKPSDVRDETDLTREGTVVARSTTRRASPSGSRAGRHRAAAAHLGHRRGRLDGRGHQRRRPPRGRVAAKAGATLPHLDSWGVAVLATGVMLLGSEPWRSGSGSAQPLTPAGRAVRSSAPRRAEVPDAVDAHATHRRAARADTR